MMNERYNYPNQYEIQQALSFCDRSFIDAFAQSRGIFITYVTKEGLIDVLSGLFFEHSDLEEIRNGAFQVHAKSTLAGFLVSSEVDKDDFNLIDVFDSRRGTVVDPKTKMSLGPIVTVTEDHLQAYRGTVEYVQWKPGRIEFLQEDARSFDYYVQKTQNENQWRILVDCARSNDAKVMENWMGTISRDITVAKIDQDSLTSSQTVHFFDELAVRGVVDEWNFIQVKRLVLRRATTSTEDEEEKEETRPSVLSGITQAILEGNSLRNNPFVKQCEEGGYRFTAMTYEYEEKEGPNVLGIRAEFKGRPKVFEVALDSFKQREGIEEILKPARLPNEQKVKMLSQFWSKAKEVFDELIAENL